MEYVKDTKVTDTTPPPAPTNVRVQGNKLTWEAEADLESGLASFVIERDGQFLANVPEQGKNPFGRPVFQNLQYSDTPTQPLVPMQFTDTKAEPGKKHTYRVIAVNTVGLKSKPSADSARADDPPKPLRSRDASVWEHTRGVESPGRAPASAGHHARVARPATRLAGSARGRRPISLGPNGRHELVDDVLGDEVFVQGVKVHLQTTEPIEIGQRPFLTILSRIDTEHVLARLNLRPHRIVAHTA